MRKNAKWLVCFTEDGYMGNGGRQLLVYSYLQLRICHFDLGDAKRESNEGVQNQ